MDRLADWVALVDARYPERDAEDWDNTGLQLGDPEDGVTAVLVCLDVTDATLDEAQARGADLVLAHHPLLFRPLTRLTPATASGRLLLRAARAGINVLAAHTNLDVAVPGTSDPVVDLLSLVDVRPLLARPPQRVKLVTFVPAEATDGVLDALVVAGAGVIGEYDACSFRVPGTGTFRPSAAANPTVGERGVRNDVAEQRLEVVVPRPRVRAAVAALRAAHPYEEVAYDLYPLLDEPGDAGLGRVGTLPEPQTLRAVADRLATGLPAPHLRVGGDLDAPVHTVAACGGAGDSLIGAAQAAGVDVYVTGDLRHHVALDARTLGLAVIDAGHFATEAAALPAFRAALERLAAERGLHARLLPSEVRTEPWAQYRPPEQGQPRA
jgi:dinuclear metal center YbgI/SA1388 family protein